MFAFALQEKKKKWILSQYHWKSISLTPSTIFYKSNRSQVPICGFARSVNQTNMLPPEVILRKVVVFWFLQLRRYDNFLDNLFKDNRHVQCLPINNHHLKVPITTSDEVSIAKEYSLVATVNHSGTLNAGHYWAFVKDGDRWLECNDRSVIKVKSSALNNSSCYILFYVQC